MFQYTQNNHFRFGYNRDWFAKRTDQNDRFTVAYGACTVEPGHFGAECLRAARLIRDCTDLPLNVLFSGGIDSEVVVRSFEAAGIPTKISILRFENDLNFHDIRYAIDYCEEGGLTYDLIDLNLLSFWENDLADYAEATNCVSPQLCTTMWLCDQVEGLPIIGSGECYLAIDYVGDYFDGRWIPGSSEYRTASWHLWEREKVASWYRHFINQDRPGIPGFFQYTPELMYAFLTDQWTRLLVSCEIRDEVENARTKAVVYNRHFELAERPKYTGFEQVMDYDSHYRGQLEKLFPTSDQVVKSEYEALLVGLKPNREN